MSYLHRRLHHRRRGSRVHVLTLQAWLSIDPNGMKWPCSFGSWPFHSVAMWAISRKSISFIPCKTHFNFLHSFVTTREIIVTACLPKCTLIFSTTLIVDFCGFPVTDPRKKKKPLVWDQFGVYKHSLAFTEWNAAGKTAAMAPISVGPPIYLNWRLKNTRKHRSAKYRRVHARYSSLFSERNAGKFLQIYTVGLYKSKDKQFFPPEKHACHQ